MTFGSGEPSGDGEPGDAFVDMATGDVYAYQ